MSNARFFFKRVAAALRRAQTTGGPCMWAEQEKPAVTLAPDRRQTLPDISVRFSPEGAPLAIRHEGRIWMVDPDVHSGHWFTRSAWWETQARAAIGTGDMVSVEHWQVQAKLSSADAELRTFVLRREPLATQWQLESIS